jgi:serine/threonine-protein kinase
VAGVDRKTEAYCAAKLLRQCDAGELLRFVREQSVRLAHPNIVSPYSWAAEDGTVLIASELVAGGSCTPWSATTGRWPRALW